MTLEIDRLGRESGWVATQHEVAQLVERYLGVDLDRRRERIARIVTENTVTSVLPSRPPSTSRRPRDKVLLWAGVSAALIAALAFLALYPSNNAARSVTVDPNAPQSMVSPVPARANAVRTLTEQSSTASADTAPTLGAATTLPTQQIEVAEPAPRPTPEPLTLPSNRPNPGSSPAPLRKAPSRSPATPAPLAPPDHISERNPYREPK
jgi:hypothetical protein